MHTKTQLDLLIYHLVSSNRERGTKEPIPERDKLSASVWDTELLLRCYTSKKRQIASYGMQLVQWTVFGKNIKGQKYEKYSNRQLQVSEHHKKNDVVVSNDRKR